jgi:hypothetical protein
MALPSRTTTGGCAMTDADRTLKRLLTEINDSADAYAMGRLLERRPDLDRPLQPRIPVPAEEQLRVSLDRVGFVAWLEQGLALASDVRVAVALRAGATWAQLGEALRCTTEEARERYDHLALLAGDAPTAGPGGGEVA